MKDNERSDAGEPEAAELASRGSRTIGIRAYLMALVVGVLAPVLMLATGYAIWILQLQQRTMDRSLAETAHILSLAFDRETKMLEAALLALGSSPHLDNRDWRAFHTQASEVSERYSGWVVLTDRNTQQIVNTLLPYGEELPVSGAPDDVRAVFATHRTTISDLFMGRAAKRNIISIFAPVLRDGAVIYTLDMAFLPEQFTQLLMDQRLPDGWTGALVDRKDVVVARYPDGQNSGERVAPAWVTTAADDADEGILQGRSSGGADIRLAYHRSAKSGWMTLVTSPASFGQAHARELAFILVAGALGSLLLAFAAAVRMGRRIATPLQALAQQAEPMVRGESVSLPISGISEVAGMQKALAEATLALRERIETRLRLQEEQCARAAAERAHEEIRRRETALRESEERYRGLTEAIASVVWTTAADGKMDAAPEWTAFTGQPAAEAAGWGWLDAVHPVDREPARKAWQRAVQSGTPYSTEYRLRDETGRYRWFEARAVPVLNGDGAVREWIGVCIDIDERKAGAERQALLTAELDHRVRNILSSVQAMISLTAQSAPSTEEFGRRLQGRVTAMARTHGLLTSEKWRGVSLARIIRDELQPYVDGEETITLTGAPDCILRPRQALDFALVIHELATNAAKYGALSVPGGRIVVDWNIREADGEARLTLEWRESGGPPVEAPLRRGFGSQLLENVLGQAPDAGVVLDFERSGVRCRIEMRLASQTPPPRIVRQKQVEQQQDAVLVSARSFAPRILVAEDEPLAALEFAQALTSAGMEVAGPVSSVGEAMDMARHASLAVAVLDVNLKGDMVFPVADLLGTRGIPVILVIGYGAGMLPERYATANALQKPIDQRLLIERVRLLIGDPVASGHG